jgi:hypothetical protein
MALIALRVIIGFGFILFGRWAYRNPTKLHPANLYTNPEAPLLVSLPRAFALLLILVGSFSILILAVARLGESIFSAVVALGLSFVSTWCLRPRIPERQSVPATVGGFLTVTGKWFIGIALAIAALTFALILVLLRR